MTATDVPVLEASPKDKITRWAEDQMALLRAGTERRLAELVDQRREARAAGNGAVAGIGDIIINQYVAFDIACTSPIQVEGLPPYRPGRVIAGGEDAFVVAFLFINPTPSVADGFAVPPAVQLAGRDFRVAAHEMNISNVTVGTNIVGALQQGKFTTPAPTLSFFIFQISPPDPGPDPKLFEINVTVDVDGFQQPYSAFATNFFDVDDDPGFLFVPPTPPGFRHLDPNRYLVYQA